jgi:hypothetical protein
MTMRQFELTGNHNSATPSTGIITINEIEVFNGSFIGPLGPYETIASGSVDIDNALASNNRVSVPTSVTVTSGSMYVALAKWNYGPTTNPVYTTEQIATLGDPATTNEAKLAIYQTVAVPPLSTADEAMLLSTDPADYAAQQAIKVSHNLTIYIQDPATMTWGLDEADCACNRTDVLINGVACPGGNSHVGVLVNAGDVLTYNSIVFTTTYYLKS